MWLTTGGHIGQPYELPHVNIILIINHGTCHRWIHGLSCGLPQVDTLFSHVTTDARLVTNEHIGSSPPSVPYVTQSLAIIFVSLRCMAKNANF